MTSFADVIALYKKEYPEMYNEILLKLKMKEKGVKPIPFSKGQNQLSPRKKGVVTNE